MNRVQFSLLAKRPARPGWPAAMTISTSTPNVAAAVNSASQACSMWSNEGFSAKPTTTSNGSAIMPLSRSSTTEPNATEVESTFLAQRATRTTSPPMVDGSTLPTNCPAK